MSAVFPKHQPIIFTPYEPDACNENQDYKLLAEYDDFSQFQVIVAPCPGAQNTILDPLFRPEFPPTTQWTIEGGFSIATGQACKDADGSTGSISQYNTLQTGLAYLMEIVIDSLFGTLYVYNGTTLVDTIETTGLHNVSFIATSKDIHLKILDGQHSVCITSCSAWSFSDNMTFGIINEAGSTVITKNLVDDPSYFTFVENTVTILFQWSDLGINTPGCYRIGFSEACENTNGQFGVFNDNFDYFDSGWNSNLGTLDAITFQNLENPDTGEIEAMVEFTDTTAGTGDIVNAITFLGIGICYTVTIGAFSTDGTGFLRIYCGTAFDDFDMTNESHNIICAGNQFLKIEAHMGTSTYIRLWDFTVELCDAGDFVFDEQSEPFYVDEEIGCTHLINLSNDDNGMGFIFEGTQFAPMARVRSEIVNSASEFLRETYHDNLGKKTVYFGEYRKHFFFNIDNVPTWLFDFMCLCFIADHFFVDGTEYFIEGEGIEPLYPEGVTNLPSLIMEISEKTQLFRNASIGNVENPITYGGVVFIVTPAGDFITDPTNNFIVEP